MRHISSDGTHYLITADNEHRLMMTSNEVVAACQAFAHAGDCIAQYRDLMELVVQTVNIWQGRIAHAVLTIRKNDILLLIAGKAEKRDDELSDVFTEFELDVAQDERFNLLRFCTLTLPHCSSLETEQFLSKSVINILEWIRAAQPVSPAED